MEKNNENVEANFQICYHAIRNERHAVLGVNVAVSSRRDGRKSEKQRRRSQSQCLYSVWEVK